MIHVAEVSKRFGAVNALSRVSLEIRAGERVAFVGTNGSGKTTLLRCILGLVRFEGKITLAGSDVMREPEVALRSVAYIPQIAPPIEAPVRDVVRAYTGLRGTSEEAVALRAQRLGLDLEGCRERRYRDLSGGMKQKLLAALALSVEAPILACDEPTANLDGGARAEFIAQLDERPRDSIVLLCSHRVDEVRTLVDRVVELGDGRITRDAPMCEIIEGDRFFRVEIALGPRAARAAELLRGSGFVEMSKDRYAADLSQDEKVRILARVLRENEDALTDVSITPSDRIRRGGPRQGARTLKVVS